MNNSKLIIKSEHTLIFLSNFNSLLNSGNIDNSLNSVLSLSEKNSLISTDSIKSENILFTFEAYNKTQKHKFLPISTIKAIKARQKSTSMEPRRNLRAKHSKRSKSTDFKNSKNPMNL